MGRWITLHIPAGPKHMLLEFPLHSKLVQSGEERSGHDSKTSENLSAFKKTQGDYTIKVTRYFSK